MIADFKVPFLDRIKLLLDLNEGIGLPLEPLGYTQEEFKKMKEERNPIIIEVINTGKVSMGKFNS
ncbi:MAG: hypothetical protein C0169_05560 [Thermodesulfobacterium geofontis]|uniref:Uncharacterized protein n=1 Tax=Thermodesulfobacterium geofontis TaxID=1295609 RepID=A0A2N7QA83_9BACT|nr:MAG: hypothetical protein C0169_05560 [Thermodesulfobacterium geofontis]